jgi:hypothetical protein
MSAPFDPYHIWLGIRPEEQPPNYYRLLGIALFEDNIEAIRDAAEQRMAHVRTYQLGRHLQLSQKILNELATAKACLLDLAKKAAYDDSLRSQAVDTSPPPPPKSRESSDKQDRLPLTVADAAAGRFASLAMLVAGSAMAAGIVLLIVFLFSSRSPEKQPRKEIAPSVAQAGPEKARSDTAVVATESEPAESRDASVPQPQAQPQPTPQAVPSVTSSDKEPGAAGTATKEQNSERPAVYNVEIEPATATLTVAGNLGTVTGEGKQRQIKVDHISGGQIMVMVSAEGHLPFSRWLTPKPGEHEDLRITLYPKPSQATQLASLPTEPRANTKGPKGWRGFVGEWDCGDIVITLKNDFTASSNKKKGRWKYVDGEARIEWNNGSRNVLRHDGQGFQKLFWPSGVRLDSSPRNVFPAVKKSTGR